MLASPASADDVKQGLRDVGYLPDDSTALVSFLAAKLGKPILVEGPAGVGKTQLAKSLAEIARPRARAPAVLRGPRRGQGAVRVELPQAAAAHPGRGRGRRLAGGAGRHLRQGVPARAPADDRDREPEAGRPADRRDRQDRPGVRGDAARAAVGLPDHDPRARPDRGDHDADRAAHLEQHARADRGAEAPLPLPLARLPGPRARARDRPPARAGARRARRAPARRGRRRWSATSTSRSRRRSRSRSTGRARCCCSARRTSTPRSSARRCRSSSSTAPTSTS